MVDFKTTVHQLQDTFEHFDLASEALVELSGEVHSLTRFVGEMAVLEEKMESIAEAGQVLLNRLTDTKQGNN